MTIQLEDESATHTAQQGDDEAEGPFNDTFYSTQWLRRISETFRFQTAGSFEVHRVFNVHRLSS